VHDPTNRSGRLKSDTGVIYDSAVVTLESYLTLSDTYFGYSIKTGEQMNFRVLATGDPLFFIASHWPSKRTYADGAPEKGEIGTALRARISTIRADCPGAFVILAGDYNDDPFAESLVQHLGATRDRVTARRNPDVLYNPFWRKLGESHDDENQSDEVRFCGTHYYRSGRLNRWHTFDQIIFSSAFLNDKGMRLVEELCGIVATRELWTKVLQSGVVFDHLPVFATVELRSFV
jgi:hypothetical protein